MHIPDGFINAPVSAAAAVVAVGGLTVAARRATDELDDRAVPLAGLTAAYVFAMQMLNFPVANGTSGHLLGGVLATVLVGPWLACVALAVVVGVQALVFADGGLSAMGLNMILIGYVPVLAGAALLPLARRIAPAGSGPIVAASAVVAWISVMLSAVVFTGFFALGGEADLATFDVGTAMLGVHALIGIGEAAITALTVSAVLASRPDLVWAARGLPPSRLVHGHV